MTIDRLRELFKDDNTIYQNIKGKQYAVNLSEKMVVSEEAFGYAISDLKDNDISYLEKEVDQQIEILGVLEVAEILGMTRAGVNWAINNNNFTKVPKPKYVNKNKRGNSYFWELNQFKDRGERNE